MSGQMIDGLDRYIGDRGCVYGGYMDGEIGE